MCVHELKIKILKSKVLFSGLNAIFLDVSVEFKNCGDKVSNPSIFKNRFGPHVLQ